MSDSKRKRVQPCGFPHRNFIGSAQTDSNITHFVLLCSLSTFGRPKDENTTGLCSRGFGFQGTTYGRSGGHAQEGCSRARHGPFRRIHRRARGGGTQGWREAFFGQRRRTRRRECQRKAWSAPPRQRGTGTEGD